jgi:signal transduction histidine kinase
VHRRYVRSTLIIVLSGYLLLSAVMAWASNQGIVTQARQRLGDEVDRISVTLIERLQTGSTVLVPADREVRFVDVSGAEVRAGVPVGDDAYAVSRQVVGYGVLTVSEPPGRVRQAQAMSAGSIVGLALLLSVVSVAFAVRQSRRLAAPLAELATEAGRLGSGDPSPVPARYGIPEVDAIAEALDASAARIGQLMESERQLTVDASHQLRSPLTAVSMRLEEILLSDDLDVVHEEATAALEQVGRVSSLVDDLMVRRTFGPAERALPVAEVVQQQVSEFHRGYAARGRGIQTVDEAGLATPVPRGAVTQVLACLLENSLVHGAGLTTVRTRRLEGAVCIEVSDQGPGVPADLARTVFERGVSGGGGTGVGLAMARSTAESVDGRLELVAARPATFALFLPSMPVAAAGSGGGGDLGEDPAAVGPEAEGGTQTDPDDVGGDVVGDG